jgi:glycosyltransferase involved in cell wall biosynthesis
VRTQALGLAHRGADITIATSSVDGQRRSETIEGLRVERFVLSGAESVLRPIRGDIEGYSNFLTRGAFDAVLLNAWQNWATDIAFRVIGRIGGRKILYSHCISTNLFLPSQPIRSTLRYMAWRPYWWSLARKMRSLDGLIFLADNGESSRFGDLEVARAARLPIHIIGNTVPIDDATPPPHSSRRYILAVGSFTWLKGFDTVLRMYAKSRHRGTYPLRLFGQEATDYGEKLRHLADELGLGPQDVSFHTGVSGAALQREYQDAVLFLMASRTECQPLVLLDAMAAGTPFVAIRTGCIGCLKGGVAVQTPHEGTSAIDGVLADRERWAELSSAGQHAVRRDHDAERNGERLWHILQGKPDSEERFR